MHKLLLFALIALILVSGCTGSGLITGIANEESKPHIREAGYSDGSTTPLIEEPPETNVQAGGVEAKEDSNYEEPEETIDLCANLNCDDSNPCTADFCNSDTNYQCEHTILSDPQVGCSGSASTCKEHVCNSGSCNIVSLSNCCGNGTCEIGENFNNCSSDCILTLTCPTSCDDGNPCTEDYCSASTNYKCKHNTIPLCCEDKENKYKCYYELAVDNLDQSLCEKSGIYKENCINELFYLQATNQKNEELCNNINADFEYVYNQTITHLWCRDECNLRKVCKFNISILNSDLGECTNINPKCIRTCYQRIATESNNLSLCNEMNTIPDTGICPFDNTSTDLGTCKMIYARKYQRYDLCPECYGYPECEISIAQATNTAESCENMSCQKMKELCYYYMANNFLDSSLCNNTGQYKIDCYECILRQGRGCKIPSASSTTCSCPSSCDDQDSCTTDICNESTGYSCQHQPITPC